MGWIESFDERVKFAERNGRDALEMALDRFSSVPFPADRMSFLLVNTAVAKRDKCSAARSLDLHRCEGLRELIEYSSGICLHRFHDAVTVGKR